MVKSTPPSDWVVYLVVLGVVAAMLVGKYLMFFDDRPSEEEAIEETAEEILEESASEVIDEVVHKVEENIK
jgi:ABC-type glycerol-3-phosphate transport system permease component